MEEQDGFIPCGAAIATDGEIVGQMAGAKDPTKAEDVMRTLFTGLRADAQAGKIRAACACYDGGYDDEDGAFVPAIVIILEHIQGPATIFHRPYRKSPDGTYEYAQMEGQTVQPEVFAGL